MVVAIVIVVVVVVVVVDDVFVVVAAGVVSSSPLVVVGVIRICRAMRPYTLAITHVRLKKAGHTKFRRKSRCTLQTKTSNPENPYPGRHKQQ